MIACKRIVTVEDPSRLILSDLPFPAGQRLEIVMIAEEDKPGMTAGELRRLLRETQNLSSAQTITEEQIAEEIAAYRAGR